MPSDPISPSAAKRRRRASKKAGSAPAATRLFATATRPVPKRSTRSGQASGRDAAPRVAGRGADTTTSGRTPREAPRVDRGSPGVAPLLLRRDARYRCFGDGLCCTDIHGIGPLDRREERELERISAAVCREDADYDGVVLATNRDGRCLFLGRRGCELHRALGSEVKPAGCRRFPLGLVATPSGGRITTDHRCPCRTMGERPPIDSEEAATSLTDRRGRLRADRRVGKTVLLESGKRIPFAAWEELEQALFDRIFGAEPLSEVLGGPSLPSLRGGDFGKVGREMVDESDDTRFGAALLWFGCALRHLVGKGNSRELLRPWADAFDRAEARSPVVRASREIFADWLADAIWSLEFVDHGSFARGRLELGVRLGVGETIAARLEKQGLRPDRAAAEAVSVIDAVGASEHWQGVVARLRCP